MKLFLKITCVLILLILIFNKNIAFALKNDYLIYKVKKGDTLSEILEKHKLSPIYGKNNYLNRTLKMNPGKIKTNGDLIFPSEKLFLPIIVNKSNNVKFVTKVKQLTDNNYLIYKVKKGDTLSEILEKHKLSPIYGKNNYLDRTIKMNPGKMKTNGDLIHLSEILYLPIIIKKINKYNLATEAKQSIYIKNITEPKQPTLIKDASNKYTVAKEENEKSIPINLKFYAGARYLTLQEYQKQSGVYTDFHSSESPIIGVDCINNWNDKFSTYFGLEGIYAKIEGPSNYILTKDEAYLFNAHIGFNYLTDYRFYIQNEYFITPDVVYQLNGITMNAQLIYTLNTKILGGLTFFESGGLKLQAEAAYILTSPFYWSPSNFGNGYEGALKIIYQASAFDIGARIYYTDRNIITNQVISNNKEIGLIGEVSFVVNK